MSATSDAELRQAVNTFLPFHESRLKVLVSKGDATEITAAAGGSFVAAIRNRSDVFGDASKRLDFCRAVSRSEFFEGRLSVWMVEAAIQGALGSAVAIQGIAADLLIETYVMALKELSERPGGSELSRFVDEAVGIAQQMRRELPAVSGEV